jgi:tRNA-2-methylthio-N6-dimethylallyladenosine synthase
MPKYYIWTIGCQMNDYDSDRLSSLFEKAGYQTAASADSADIIVINSCVVRQNAENKVINKLTNLKALKRSRPELKLAVTGCLVNSDTDKLHQKFPYVDYFFKPGGIPDWLAAPGISEPVIPERPSVTAYLSIIRGCNNFCSYCIVPYRRGREESRPADDILCEVRALVRRGVREVTLLGQNVDSYGHDLPGRPDLADLLTEINKVEGLYRIRFLTNHPKDMSPRLIEAIANLDKVCEQINLPVQAGDDVVLKAMRRGYTAAYYCDLVDRIRRANPGIAITSDIIVGFPGETEAQFENTYRLMSDLRFDTVHLAAYSPREDTLAAREKIDDVPAAEKARRLKLTEELQERIALEINNALLGSTVEVLVDGKKGGKWRGRTRTDKLVFFSSSENCFGKLVSVKIEKTGPWSMQGKFKEFKC